MAPEPVSGQAAGATVDSVSQTRERLLAEALGQPWYHTIEFAPGVVTQGLVDWRSRSSRLLPTTLADKRALDIGTFDGFWAFEMERRGAEVIAADLDTFAETEWPPIHRERLLAEVGGDRSPSERFHLAAKLLDSQVKRVGSSIYDLDVEKLNGPVDFAVIGDLLLHLRDPVRGLERVHSILRPDGLLLLIEPFNPLLSILRPRAAAASLQSLRHSFNWWVGNLRCLHDWLVLAGFDTPRRKAIFRLKAIKEQRQWHVALEAKPTA